MLKSFWERRKEQRLIHWATHRFGEFALPFAFKINHSDAASARRSIEKMIEDMKRVPARIVIYDSEILPIPSKSLVYFNIDNIKVI